MRFLHPDSPLMQFLGKLADIMLVNLLFLLCSLPLVTVGAAMTAAYKVTQDMVLQNDHTIIKRFFRTFHNDFKQSTIVWLLFLLACGILVYDGFLVFLYCEGGVATTLYVFLGVLAFLVLGTATYLYPLIARYNNTLRNHTRNAFYLMLGKIHRTIPAIILGLIPVAVPYFFTPYFIKCIYLWILLLFGLEFYGVCYLLKPVFLLNQQTHSNPHSA